MFKNKNESRIVYKCTVRLLEDSDILECEFQHTHKGNYLLSYLCQQLEIKEKDYFGLRYTDTSKQRHWLDLGKSIIKQCKDVDPVLFSFRVKFYPADPFRLTGNGRLMLYQQLKRDLRHGRLYCSMGEAAALGALIVQEELGDYDERIHVGDYVSSLNLALRQTDVLEKKVMELHKKREPGQNPKVAMDEFMGIARGLETYGIDPHPVKDHRGSLLYVGINYAGMSTFVAGKRSQHFRWNEVHKINFEGKMFIAHLSYTDASREPKKHTIGFKCASGAACRYVWRCAIEQMLFFTLPNSQNASVVSGGGFFSWGTKFKYTGRTEREILTETINALREQKMNSAASSKRCSSVPATPSSPQGDLAQIRKHLRNSYISTNNSHFSHYHAGYSSLPRSTISEPLGNCTMAATDSLGNVVQVSTLPPVSEEARLRASNIESRKAGSGRGELNLCGGNTTEIAEYYFRDSIEHSSTESGLANTYVDASGRPLPKQPRLPKHNLQHNNSSTSHASNANAVHYDYATSNVSGLNSTLSKARTATPPHAAKNDDKAFVSNVRQNATNSAKSVRKFHILHAFIPSFIFVVFAMAISAILILESESEIFERLRNMPEMISLRYQYYQPLKNFLAKKLHRK